MQDYSYQVYISAHELPDKKTICIAGKIIDNIKNGEIGTKSHYLNDIFFINKF